MFYLDFCKAFDSVPHHRLLTKLRNLGISGNTLDIIKDFLSGRRFKTFVGGAYSYLRNVLCKHMSYNKRNLAELWQFKIYDEHVCAH